MLTGSGVRAILAAVNGARFPVAIDFGLLADGDHRLILADGRRVYAKVRRGRPADFFAAEARGLALLGQAGARVPDVIFADAIGIALEDLGRGDPAASDWERAGRMLATVHRRRGERFGFDTRGYCGDSPQDNAWDDDGFRFFAERRLLPQTRRAFDAGRLDAGQRDRIERLCGRLREHLPAAPPVLVHGDLWLGNLHAGASGEFALIDGGAAHFGWAEADLAMLVLFGQPPPAFFAAYDAASAIDAGWRARAPLYNLYHLLNHLNLFGAGYLGAVLRSLAKYD